MLGIMLGKTLGKIIVLSKDNPALFIPELSESAIERAIRKLRQAGLLKRVGAAKEVSEGVMPVIPAILKSIYDAIGVRINELPVNLRADLAGAARKKVIFPDSRGGSIGPPRLFYFLQDLTFTHSKLYYSF